MSKLSNTEQINSNHYSKRQQTENEVGQCIVTVARDALVIAEGLHACHISHCEIKSHRIQPIRKLTHRRIFKSHRISRSIFQRFYEKININHTVLCQLEVY